MSTVLELIGNTPQVEIKSLLKKDGVRLFAKLESQNPGGSVKDRAAYSMIKGALERGEIKEGTKLIEPTSGNTGIALAMIARLYNLDIELVMPENSTAERIQTMKAFGAKVTLTFQDAVYDRVGNILMSRVLGCKARSEWRRTRE